MYSHEPSFSGRLPSVSSPTVAERAWQLIAEHGNQYSLPDGRLVKLTLLSEFHSHKTRTAIEVFSVLNRTKWRNNPSELQVTHAYDDFHPDGQTMTVVEGIRQELSSGGWKPTDIGEIPKDLAGVALDDFFRDITPANE